MFCRERCLLCCRGGEWLCETEESSGGFSGAHQLVVPALAAPLVQGVSLAPSGVVTAGWQIEILGACAKAPDTYASPRFAKRQTISGRMSRSRSHVHVAQILRFAEGCGCSLRCGRPMRHRLVGACPGSCSGVVAVPESKIRLEVP